MDEKKKTTILIVEDDTALQTLYLRKFQKEGFRVIVAGDGEEGYKLTTEHMPDFILLDNMLPKINGLEVLKLLKKDDKTKSIPVLVLSNLAFREEKDRALGFGALDYVSKAAQSPEEIVNRVKELLGIK